MTTVSTFSQKTDSIKTRLARNIIILLTWAAWIWLYSPTFGYLRHIFLIADFRTNQILLLGFCCNNFLKPKTWHIERKISDFVL